MMVWKPVRLGGLLLAAGLVAAAVASCVGVKAPPDETGGTSGTGGGGASTGGVGTGGSNTGGVPGTGGDIITVDGGNTGGVVTPTGGAGGKATGGKATGGAMATGGVMATGGAPASDAGVLTSGVKVKLSCTAGMTNAASLNFSIVNDGPGSLDTSGFSFRYWYTSDDIPQAMQTAVVEQVQPMTYFPKGSVTVTKVPLDPVRTGADAYLDIVFKKTADGGTPILVGPGGKIELVLVRLNTTVNPAFELGNDYSCVGGTAAANGNKKVTAYADGTLIWGTEPPL